MKLIVEKHAEYRKTPSDKHPRAGQLTCIGATFWIKDRDESIVEGVYDYAEIECSLRDNAPMPTKLVKLGKNSK